MSVPGHSEGSLPRRRMLFGICVSPPIHTICAAPNTTKVEKLSSGNAQFYRNHKDPNGASTLGVRLPMNEADSAAGSAAPYNTGLRIQTRGGTCCCQLFDGVK